MDALATSKRQKRRWNWRQYSLSTLLVVVTNSKARTVALWRVEGGFELIRSLKIPSEEADEFMSAVAWLPEDSVDGLIALKTATGNPRKIVMKILQLSDGKVLHKIACDQSPVATVLSPDRRMLAIGELGTVSVCDPRSIRCSGARAPWSVGQGARLASVVTVWELAPVATDETARQ